MPENVKYNKNPNDVKTNNNKNPENKNLKENTPKNTVQKQQSKNLQDLFLEEVRDFKIPITIFFTNGFQLKGVVKDFDNFTILIMKDGKPHLLYKSAITTIVSSKILENI